MGSHKGKDPLLRDSECSEWGLSDESALVVCQLADQFESSAATGDERAADGICVVAEVDEPIRSLFVVNKWERPQRTQELSGKAPIVDPIGESSIPCLNV